MAAAEKAHASGGPWARWGWLMAVIWMVFLIYPVLALLESDASGALIVLGWAALVAFAVLYVTGFVLGMKAGWGPPAPSVLAIFWASVVCVALLIPAIDTGVLSFFPFLMSFASYGLRGAWHWAVTGAAIGIALVVIVVTDRFAYHATILAIIVMMAVVNTINTWLISRSVADDALRVQLATSEERETLARDVHDLLGHSLTVIKLKSELAQRLVERDPARAHAELEEISRLAGEAIAGVRATVTGLRGATLADQVEASRRTLESAGLTVEVDGAAEALTPAQALPAGWIVREATTNILRHADGSRVHIRLAPGTVVVEDDGRGAKGAVGNGIRGMAERASAAGATLRVEDLATSGTRVSVTW
ncbi:sensor histidine kinase [Microbacterium sp. NPDC089189]|uniref:sensor histidine kinase n=1 Tax=Microbacterium sp. NPDC089189 TaxID=3154972 RepID=UPI0034345A34